MSDIIGYVLHPYGMMTVVHPKYGYFFDTRDINDILQTEDWDYKELERNKGFLAFFPLSFDEEGNTESNMNENASAILNEKCYGTLFVCAENVFLDKNVVNDSVPKQDQNEQPKLIPDNEEIDINKLVKSIVPIYERLADNVTKVFPSYCYYFQFLVSDFNDCDIVMVHELKNKFHLRRTTMTAVRVGEESSEFGEMSWGFITNSQRCLPYVIQYIHNGNGYTMYKAYILKTISEDKKSDYPFSDIIDAMFDFGVLEIPDY